MSRPIDPSPPSPPTEPAADERRAPDDTSPFPESADRTPAAADVTQPAGGPPTERTRYPIVQHNGERCLEYGSKHALRIWVKRGLTINEAARKKYPTQTIFLDGVFEGPPFLDNAARHYSLDHHAGCIRAFTLATCEQAAVMILQGLPLAEGEWSIYLNEPDLDALMAAWILANHLELLADEHELLRRAMPLIRVEGVIDAHGLNMEILSALPHRIYEDRHQRLERLRAREKQLRAEGLWNTTDWLAYTRDMLDALDRTLFPSAFLQQLEEIEEVGQVELQGQRVALLCRSRLGIYDVETRLKERYEKQLGLIVLDRGDGHYTLRQVDPFLPANLTALYPLLNASDPRVIEDPAAAHWGGSEDIGGSPRLAGSALDGQEILKAVQKVFTRRGSWLGRLIRRGT